MAGASSLLDYVDNFVHLGNECAYVERRGYRTVRWSYLKVYTFAARFAEELARRGVDKGERVIIWGPNSAEWIVAFLGCAMRGVVAVPLDEISTPEFAVRVHQKTAAKLLVCSRHHLPSERGNSIVLEELEQTLAHHHGDPSARNFVQGSDPLEIVFTSGTTAEPKGVVITHANVLGNLQPLETEIRKYLKYERFVHPVRFLNLLPLSHVFGQFLGIFLPQITGGTVIFQESLNPSEVIGTIRREHVSVLVAVPRMLQSLKEKVERELKDSGREPNFQRRFQSSRNKHFLHRWWIFRDIRRRFGWKFWAFICGGAALDRNTEEFWGRLGYAVVQGYGLTETTSIISVNHPFHLGKNSVGKVLPGRELKLAGDGEILIRGKGVAAGYWTGQQLQPVTHDEGWYHTGDIGAVDTDGNLYFKGRKKEVIVTSAGMNIYPEDLESALRGQPAVKDCAVVPLSTDGNAEPCAVLILRDSTDPKFIVEQANAGLADYQRMRHWFVWKDVDFPRTANQKPRRQLIEQTVRAGLESSSVSESPESALAELITRITGRAPTHLAASSDLDADLNLTSLDRVQLFGALEDRYQLDLSETSFSSVQTVGDLERLLHGETPALARYHFPRWVQRWPVTWIRLVTDYLLLLPSVFILGWPRVVGRENLRGIAGPVLVVCNHIGDIDLGFVKAALPFRLHHKLATATGGETLESYRVPPRDRTPFLRAFNRLQWTLGVSLLNLFPLPREAGFRHSFAYAGESVDRGYSILIFPEGRHSEDGRMRPFRSGIGLLAQSLDVPIIPMRIDGLFELKHAGKKFAPPHAITVRIGPPVRYKPTTPPDEIARDLQERIQLL